MEIDHLISRDSSDLQPYIYKRKSFIDDRSGTYTIAHDDLCLHDDIWNSTRWEAQLGYL